MDADKLDKPMVTEYGDSYDAQYKCDKCESKEFQVFGGFYMTGIKCLKCGLFETIHWG